MATHHTALTEPPAAAPTAAQQSEVDGRVQERVDARRAQIAALQSQGIAYADTPERVALRVDRLSRIVAGEPAPRSASPVAAAPEALIAAAVERAAPELGVAAEAAAAPSALDAAGIVLEAIIGSDDLLEVRFLGAGARAARAVGRVRVRNAGGRDVA